MSVKAFDGEEHKGGVETRRDRKVVVADWKCVCYRPLRRRSSAPESERYALRLSASYIGVAAIFSRSIRADLRGEPSV